MLTKKWLVTLIKVRLRITWKLQSNTVMDTTNVFLLMTLTDTSMKELFCLNMLQYLINEATYSENSKKPTSITLLIFIITLFWRLDSLIFFSSHLLNLKWASKNASLILSLGGTTKYITAMPLDLQFKAFIETKRFRFLKRFYFAHFLKTCKYQKKIPSG